VIIINTLRLCFIRYALCWSHCCPRPPDRLFYWPMACPVSIFLFTLFSSSFVKTTCLPRFVVFWIVRYRNTDYTRYSLLFSCRYTVIVYLPIIRLDSRVTDVFAFFVVNSSWSIPVWCHQHFVWNQQFPPPSLSEPVESQVFDIFDLIKLTSGYFREFIVSTRTFPR